MTEKDKNIPSTHEIKQWILSTSRGDQSSFTMLLQAYWNKVYTQAITYLKSAEQAQEITQDIFVKLWSNKEKLVGVDNFSNYLFILSRNEIISALRKKKNDSVGLSDGLEELIMQPDKQFQYKESYNRFLLLVEELPPVRKKVFTMSRLEGKSYEEIGDELNISRNGVKDHIVKALNFLRSRFSADQILILVLFLRSLFNNF